MVTVKRALSVEKRGFNLVQQVVCYYPCSRVQHHNVLGVPMADGGDL